MKVSMHTESIKQKEIVKTSIFLSAGFLFLVVKLMGLLGL